jgi:hypothetical protein
MWQCPKDPSHQLFEVTAHVAESWIIDPAGDFQELGEGCTDILHHPDEDDYTTCTACGEQAIWRKD